RLTFDRATELANRGDVGQALVWFSEALGLAQEAGADELEHDVRVNLAGWRRHLHRLRGSFAHPEAIHAAAFEANGQGFFVAATDAAGLKHQIQYRDLLGQVRQEGRSHPAPIRALAYDTRRELLL